VKTDKALEIIADHCGRDRESYFTDCMHDTTTRFNLVQAGDKPSKVLLVCHADVHHAGKGTTPQIQGGVLTSPALDDRAGLALALDILPAHGLKLDVLITDNEETGGSTASNIKESILARYNFIVELDRKGCDAVTYDLDNEQFLLDLEGSGFEIGMGTFSDICELETDRCCVNLGIGYNNEHTKFCTLDVKELAKNMKNLLAFYKKHQDTEYIRRERPVYAGRFGTARSSFDWEWDERDPYHGGHNPYRRTTPPATVKPYRATGPVASSVKRYAPVVKKATPVTPYTVKKLPATTEAYSHPVSLVSCYCCGGKMTAEKAEIQCGLCDMCYCEQLEAVELG